MKPIVIAGNGPSLTKIDYSRLPRDFDLFRCNQFYFEDRYFLGKKLKGVFFNPSIFKEQFFTLYHLRQRGEYEVEDVYCTNLFLSQHKELAFQSAKSFFPYLKQMNAFHQLLEFHKTFYRKHFTTGVVMLIAALAQGYKEIYLTGIDFYRGGGTDYAFDTHKPNLCSKDSNFKTILELEATPHTEELDVEAIKLALSIPDVKLYAISPKSALSEILPLAPILKEHYPLEVIKKPSGYIDDLLYASTPSLQQKMLFYGISEENFFIKLALDFKRLIMVLTQLILRK